MVALSMLLALVGAAAALSNYMDQSFFFDYSPDSQTVPVPVTSQCETLNINWQRTSASTGPSPSAPYFLQVYTSAFVFPFVVEAGSGLSFDWQVPFGPGTLYQMCMFDKNGYTGGCQGMYTMIANTTADEVACANASFPLGPLDIDAQVEDGPLSMYGWVNQCTDISITPKNGTPPYILTIAPTLHPPMNITLDDMSTVNYTVDISWGSSFFISVVDSEFNRWSYGPLHSGSNGPTACLAQGDFAESSDVSGGAVAGIGIGGALLGALVGIGGTWIFFSRRQPQAKRQLSMSSAESEDPFDPHRTTSAGHMPGGSASLQYQVEPFRMPSDLSTNQLAITMSQDRPSNQVYVVHHDGGRAPVTVYHEDGTEVVELPPRYANTPHSARSTDHLTRRTSSYHDASATINSDQRHTQSGNYGESERVSPPTSVTANPVDFFIQPRQTSAPPKKLQPNRRPPTS